MSIKSRQVAGVTTLVLFIVAVLSAFHLATLARLSLNESASRGDLLRQAIFQRARDVAPLAAAGASRTASDPQAAYAALQKDGGIRSLLQSAVGFSRNVTYAAIVNREGIAVAHSFENQEGQQMPDQDDLAGILGQNSLQLLRAVYSDRTFEIREPLLLGDKVFGSIRIGVSTLLVKNELREALKTALQSVLLALLISTVVAMLLAQWMLRPIHVIQSGLTRLGRGELDVRLELPEGEEFKGLGTSFDAVSQQLSAVRAKALNAPATDFASVVENLEDAVALFNPDGELIFCNPAMGSVLPQFASAETRRLEDMAPPDNPVRQLVERTLAAHRSQGPVSVALLDASLTPVHGVEARLDTRDPERVDYQIRTAEGDQAERLLMTHPIDDATGKFVGAMLVARNLGYLNQVHSTLNYSRKLAALGRLMAGVAHEVKNPLNAMTIHLELLKQKLANARQLVAVGGGDVGNGAPDVTKHVDVIGSEIQRLDQVVNGFLKFARPDELKLQPLKLEAVIGEVATTIGPEAERMNVTVRAECPRDLPEINADPSMLRQALLNLALNACQAMPNGGALRLAARPLARQRVEVVVEDTGVGIPPEHLQKIFDLYFTTKDKGSGIGLSMVYRIVQLHDGEVEVQSTPGSGTRFRLVFPQA
jgi:signal transduction histidine kinase